MALQNIIRATTVEETTHTHHFDFVNLPGGGYAFDVAEDGTLLPTNPGAEANYVACLTGTIHGEPVVNRGVRVSEFSYRNPAHGTCPHCGSVVWLDSTWANECACGVEYDFSGSELAPRSQWGEETGESF